MESPQSGQNTQTYNLDIPDTAPPGAGDDPSGSGLKNYGNMGVPNTQAASSGKTEFYFVPPAGYKVVDFRYKSADTWYRASHHDPTADWEYSKITTGGVEPTGDDAWGEDATGGRMFRLKSIAPDGTAHIRDYGHTDRQYTYVLEIQCPTGDNIICDPEIDNEGA